jgi:hypothetical protein
MLPDWLTGAGFVAGVASAGVGAYCARALRRTIARMPTPEDVERCVQWRLMELVPLPYLGDRSTVLDMLRGVALERPLAVFVMAESPLLIARDGDWDAPVPADARWVELHHETLARGEHVQQKPTGVLVPLLTRDGRLTGVLVVGGHRPVSLDDGSRAALRCVAGWLDRAILADSKARECQRTAWRLAADAPLLERSTS